MTNKVLALTDIRQGESLSPILFNIIMDEIIKDVKAVAHGYRMSDNELNVICNAVILAKNKDNLQRRLYWLQLTAQKF